MHWILQENLFKETEWDTLVNALERFKIPYSVHKVVPFVGELIPDVTNKSGTKVICFGSYSLRHTAKRKGWTPGVYDLFEQNFVEQLKHWGKMLLNADCTVIAFKDADLLIPQFIRPIDDSKYFAGRVFEPDEWNAWVKSIVADHHDYGSGLTPDTLVQICHPKRIIAEYRYWIVDQQIVTRSLYKRGGKVIYSNKDWDIPKEADSFAWRVLQTDLERGIGVNGVITLNAGRGRGWRPHDAFVLDICSIEGSEQPEWRIVEINTINSAGFYAGNVVEIINALEFMER